jgi:hypothetical protein
VRVPGEALPIVRLSFEIFGASFDPAEVTARLGLESSAPPGGGHQDDLWSIALEPSETLEIDEMLSVLAPCQDALVGIYRELDVEARLVCTVEPASALAPAVSFPAHVVRWAAEHHVELDVDLIVNRLR